MILLTFNIYKPDFLSKKIQQVSYENWAKTEEKNIDTILKNLQKHEVFATFFVTVPLVELLQNTLLLITKSGHEIALYYDGEDFTQVKSAKIFLEKLTGKTIKGIRQKEHAISVNSVQELGCNYLSEIDKSDAFFMFKKLERNTQISEEKGIQIIPESISSISQLPINEFVFQYVPISYYNNMILETLRNNDFLQFYLDSWQFSDFKNPEISLPFYKRYNLGSSLNQKFTAFLQFCEEKEIAISRVKDYLF